MTLRCGITTGTCAAAAAQAAAAVLAGNPPPCEVEVQLPGGQAIRVAILYVREKDDGRITAAVRKDAGDDPDATDGLEVQATISWAPGDDVTFAAGEGVGRVTKPGLQIPPGEPAINPVPRRMIAEAIRRCTTRGVCVEIAIPGGREIAVKTFNPRLGIEGGLSVLGTTGIVRPYCTKALRDALKCSLDVAVACGITAPVLVPGNIGAKAARRHFALRDEQLIEVSNEWGFSLDLASVHPLRALMVLGHPGKLTKLAMGQWDTHSARSSSAVGFLGRLCEEVLQGRAADSPTTEGIFAALPPTERTALGDELARRVRNRIEERIRGRFDVAVFLSDMAGDRLGSDGEFELWQ